MEYTEGYQTIVHEDGSTTHISVEHVPYIEPLSTKAQILWTTGITVATLAMIGSPLLIEEWLDRRLAKTGRVNRQEKNREIFNQLKPS